MLVAQAAHDSGITHGTGGGGSAATPISLLGGRTGVLDAANAAELKAKMIAVRLRLYREQPGKALIMAIKTNDLALCHRLVGEFGASASATLVARLCVQRRFNS
jgi:hypothetical protein